MWKNYVKRIRCMRKVLVTLMLSSVILSSHALSLSSVNVPSQGFIPRAFTCQGVNASPSLSWRGAPDKTQSFVLLMTDPDARAVVGYTFIHWVVFDISAKTTMLPKGSVAGVRGVNSRQTVGYTGPCPPAGHPHRYIFQLYALDVPSLHLLKGASMADVLQAMQGHVLASATLIGFYKRIG